MIFGKLGKYSKHKLKIETDDAMGSWLKYQFIQHKGIEWFSLSDCSMSLATIIITNSTRKGLNGSLTSITLSQLNRT